MQINYIHGELTVAELRKLNYGEIVQLYNQMRKEGISFGLSESRYPELKRFTSVDDAIKRSLMIFSSVIAVKESHEAVLREDKQEEIPQKRTESIPVVRPQKTSNKMAKSKVQDTDIITVLVDKNPKSRGAATRFDYYYSGITVKEYVELVGDRAKAVADILWDTEHGWIRYESAEESEAA